MNALARIIGNRRNLLAVGAVVVLVGGGYLVHRNRSAAVREALVKQIGESLQAKVSIGEARLGVFGSGVTIRGLEVGPPAGFKGEGLLSVERIDAEVGSGQFSKDPIQVDSLTLTRPILFVEMTKNRPSFYSIMLNKPKAPANDNPGDGTRDDGEPMRFKVGRVVVQDATVWFLKGIPDLRHDISAEVARVEIGSLTSGRDDASGVPLREVAGRIMAAVVAQALGDKLPNDPRRHVAQSIGDVANFVGGQFKADLETTCKPLATVSKDVAPRGTKPDLDNALDPADLDTPR